MNWKCQHPSHISSSCCPLSSPVRVYLLNKLASNSARNASMTWHLSYRRPTYHPSDARARLHQRPHCSGNLEGWQKKQLLTGWICCCCCVREHSWGYYCTCGFEEFGSLTWEWRRIMCLHDTFCLREVQNQDVTQTNTHNTTEVQWLCSLTSCPQDTHVTSHLSCALCRTRSWSHCVFNLELENNIKC